MKGGTGAHWLLLPSAASEVFPAVWQRVVVVKIRWGQVRAVAPAAQPLVSAQCGGAVPARV